MGKTIQEGIEFILSSKDKSGPAHKSYRANVQKSEQETKRASKSMATSFGDAKMAVLGYTAAAASVYFTVKKLVDLAGVQEMAERKVAQVIKSTGGAAGVTAQQMNTLAANLQKVTTYGDETILGAEHLLLTFTKIGGNVIPQATEAVLNMATATGQDLNSAAIQLGKALNDPITGATTLRRVGVSLTEQQMAQIKTMQEQNDLYGAQKIILDELAIEFGGLARAVAETDAGKITQFNNALGDLGEVVGGQVLPVITPLIEDLTAIMYFDESSWQGLADLTEKLEVLKAIATGDIFSGLRLALGMYVKNEGEELAVQVKDQIDLYNRLNKALDENRGKFSGGVGAGGAGAGGGKKTALTFFGPTDEDVFKQKQYLYDLEVEAAQKAAEAINSAHQKRMQADQEFIEFKRMVMGEEKSIQDQQLDNLLSFMQSGVDISNEQYLAMQDAILNQSEALLARNEAMEIAVSEMSATIQHGYSQMFNSIGDMMTSFMFGEGQDFQDFMEKMMKQLVSTIIQGVMTIIAQYASLITIRLINKAIPGIGAVAHTGGYIGGDGGLQRMHSGGLAADEYPYILQRGEGVMSASSMRSIGKETFLEMNKTGEIPESGNFKSSQTNNFTITVLDGRGLREIVRDQIVPMLQDEKATGWA